MRPGRWFAACLAAVVAALAGAAPAHADTIRQMQWHLDALQVPAAHQVTRGPGVIVAVVDGGVDASHPDLAGQVLPGAGFGPGSPSNGWSSGAGDGTRHGTAMAGVIAAKGGGPDNALGVAPGAKILPVAVGGDAEALDTDVAAGIVWAVDHGAKVINISLASPVAARDYEVEAVRYALSRDVVVVAGAGNVDKGMSQVGSPANIPGVVAVSGVIHDGGFWSGSASGPQTVIAAPAVKIVSTTPRSSSPTGYSTGDGTSDATAIVSGTAALIRAKFPHLNAANVINRLIATAKDQGAPGRDNLYGYGTVRVLDALTKSVPEVTANPLLGAPLAAASESSRSSISASGEGGQLVPGVVLVGIVLVLGLVATTIIVILVMVIRRKKPVRRPPVGHRPPYPPGQHPPPPPLPPAPPPWARDRNESQR